MWSFNLESSKVLSIIDYKIPIHQNRAISFLGQKCLEMMFLFIGCFSKKYSSYYFTLIKITGIKKIYLAFINWYQGHIL